MPLAVLGAPPAFKETVFVIRPHLPSRLSLHKIVDRFYQSRILTNNGPFVERLETSLAAYLGVKYVVATASATLALQLLIRAAELRGEVIIPAFTFVATAHALTWEGIRPIFADIEAASFSVDPQSIEQQITRRTTGVIAVNLFGNPCAIDALQRLCKKHGLKLFFDSSQALGSSYGSRRLGGFGDAEVFSFHATKIINGFEGGVIATNNARLDERLRLLRNFGFAGYDHVASLGINGKMNEFSAAVILEGLKNLGPLMHRNQKIHQLYKILLRRIPGLRCPEPPLRGRSNAHGFPIRVQSEFGLSRDQLCDVLWKENILARRYFYPGCHGHAPYVHARTPVHLKMTDRCAAEVLCLPCYPSLSPAMVRKIAAILTESYQRRKELASHYARHRIDPRIQDLGAR